MHQLQLPPLEEGESYAGAFGDLQGNLYHLVLLPGDSDDATQAKQLEWAKSIGGDLPNKVEIASLWVTNRDQFKKDWYWTNQDWELGSGSAWCQDFFNGSQNRSGKVSKMRARAVRRLPIQSFIPSEA